MGLIVCCQGDEQLIDLKQMFGEPNALVDQDGEVIATRLGGGHPVICDWNNDGAMDIILGCKKGMFSKAGQILLVENMGNSKTPKFKWQDAIHIKLEGKDTVFTANCG
jgi:hypothetical protein